MPTLSRSFSWSLACLAVASLLTRFWGLGQWSFDHDELITAVRGQDRLWGVTGPVFYWLWNASTTLLGPTEFAARLPSALLGAASIPLFALTWRRFIGDRAALLGSWAILLCGWHLGHSQFARYYAGVFFFASLSYYLYLRAIESDSWRWLAGSLLAGTIAALFHPSAAAVLAFTFAATLIFRVIGDRLGVPFTATKVFKVHLLLAGVGAVIAVPIVASILLDWSAEGLPAPGAILYAMRFAKSVEIPTLLLAAAGWLMLLRSDRRLGVFLVIAIGMPILIAIAGAQFVGMRNDYLFFTLPLIVVAVAVFIDQSTRLLTDFARPAVATLLLLLFAPTFASQYLEHMSLDVRNVVAYVNAHWRPGDQALPISGGFRFYAPDSMNLIDIDEDLRNRNLHETDTPDADWAAVLKPLLDYQGRTWIIVRQSRSQKSSVFTDWLGQHAHLVWRRYATRLDEEVDGFEVWLVVPDKVAAW